MRPKYVVKDVYQQPIDKAWEQMWYGIENKVLCQVRNEHDTRYLSIMVMFNQVFAQLKEDVTK